MGSISSSGGDGETCITLSVDIRHLDSMKPDVCNCSVLRVGASSRLLAAV